MLKHENPNIEIINKNLWAVRFSLIPYIPQITFTPDPALPLERIPGELGRNGLMLLNKDYKFYDQLKSATISAMKLKDKQIRREMKTLSRSGLKNITQTIWNYCLLAEIERRKYMKGGVT